MANPKDKDYADKRDKSGSKRINFKIDLAALSHMGEIHASVLCLLAKREHKACFYIGRSQVVYKLAFRLADHLTGNFQFQKNQLVDKQISQKFPMTSPQNTTLMAACSTTSSPV